MTTVIADARVELQARHRLGTHGSAPSAGQIDGWLRDAFKLLIAAVPPILKGGITLDDQRVGSLPEDALSVLFVASQHKLLQDTEWDEMGDYIWVGRGSAAPDSTVTVWYIKNFQIDDTTADVDTTDIFAQDRLQEPALVLAGQQIQLRLSASSASRGGGKNAQMYRVMQQERDTLVALLKVLPDGWMQRRLMKQKAQLALGTLPPADNPLRGLVNLSRSPNLLTGDLS
jgi:hypothetical protein